MIQVTRSEHAAFLRQDLAAFFERCFYHLNPGATYLPNWHIELIAAELTACLRGENRRLIFTMPPRHLKSQCVSVAFVAWLLGHNASARIMCVSYGDALAAKFSRDCRDIMMSDWYQEIFATRLSPYKQAVEEFETTDGGFRLALSVHGPVTGRGADYIIIDDPQKPVEAFSDTQRETTNALFPNTLYSRLNEKKDGCLILVMQRLHEDDLAGHLISQGGWKVVSFPAIAVENEEHVIRTPYGSYTHRRLEGQALHPERESLEILGQIRQTLGVYDFASQYMQAPAPLGGGIVKREWFRSYGPAELPEKFDRIIQSWDTASKASELNDYSVCTSWGVKDKHFYLLHVLRKKFNYPELKRAVREQARAHGAQTVLVEDTSAGTPLIQDLAAEGLPGITKYTPSGDKVMRMRSQTAVIENGLVHLPREAHWLDEYLHEMTTFPRGKHDDQVDSTAQLLDWARHNAKPSAEEYIAFFERQLHPREHPKQTTVRMRAPAGMEGQNIYVGNGSATIGPDGIVEVNEDQAQRLLGNRQGWTRLP